MFHLTGAPAGLANISKIISVKAISTKWLQILAPIFDSWKLKANKKVNEEFKNNIKEEDTSLKKIGEDSGIKEEHNNNVKAIL